jgi:hypothetical protein
MKFKIRKATKTQAKGRIGLIGPAGSGKTYTALTLGRELTNGGQMVVLDSEAGSSEKYADKFSFDIMVLEPPFTPEMYTNAIKFAEIEGYAVIVIDSLSHAWAGQGGALEMVDNNKARYKNNAYAAWRDVTPKHNALVEAMIQSAAHIIACMRSKTEYVQEKDERGHTVIRKVGMAPVQREGMDYEFDIVFDLDWDHRGIVTKSRYDELADAVILKPGQEVGQQIYAWLTSGAVAPIEPHKVEAVGVADMPKAKQAKSLPARKQKDLLAWARETHNLDGKGVGSALKAAGITEFDPEKWDEMIAAIDVHVKPKNHNGPENGQGDGVELSSETVVV